MLTRPPHSTNSTSPEPTGGMRLSLPPHLAGQVRAEAARLREDPAALAAEVLDLVFTDGLLAAVLDRKDPPA